MADPILVDGQTLEEISNLLLVAMLAATDEGNVGAANVAMGLIRDLRTQETDRTDKADAKKAARAARRKRPEALSHKKRLMRSLRTYQEIADTGSGIARINAQKAADAIIDRLDVLAAQATPEKVLSAAERLAVLTEDCRGAPDEELEVVVREWLSRLKYDLSVDSDGVPHLVRSGLRLVE